MFDKWTQVLAALLTAASLVIVAGFGGCSLWGALFDHYVGVWKGYEDESATYWLFDFDEASFVWKISQDEDMAPIETAYKGSLDDSVGTLALDYEYVWHEGLDTDGDKNIDDDEWEEFSSDGGNPATLRYSVSGDTMTLYWPDGDGTTLKQIDDG